jgi:threonine aldolase
LTFASDNWAGASEPVIAALTDAARKGGPAYGNDNLTRRVEARFAEIFEHDLRVFFVGSGTAANALALSAYARPGGIVFAHSEAHIQIDEAGATEFFGGGAKILPIQADAGKLTPAAVRSALERVSPDGEPHRGQPVALSITQITELGAVYRPDEIAALGDVAHDRGMALHMDGARFANAVAALGVSPADLTWRRGVDVLSFGGTKNGCLAAEAVIFFNPAHARDAAFLRQRAGHGFSKNWFIAAQFDAYLTAGHWLELAAHANAMGARLASALADAPGARLALGPAANELFVNLTREADEALRAAGARYYPCDLLDGVPVDGRPSPNEVLVRLVTSWQTRPSDVDRFVSLLGAGL